MIWLEWDYVVEWWLVRCAVAMDPEQPIFRERKVVSLRKHTQSVIRFRMRVKGSRDEDEEENDEPLVYFYYNCRSSVLAVSKLYTRRFNYISAANRQLNIRDLKWMYRYRLTFPLHPSAKLSGSWSCALEMIRKTIDSRIYWYILINSSHEIFKKLNRFESSPPVVKQNAMFLSSNHQHARITILSNHLVIIIVGLIMMRIVNKWSRGGFPCLCPSQARSAEIAYKRCLIWH